MTSLWLTDAPPIPTDDFEPGACFDDVVVGAGLTGLITAVLLARAGRAVAVVEARSPGTVTTGNSTNKISVLQGTQVSSIRKNHSAAVAKAYVEGNLEGQAWLLHYCAEHNIPVETRDCFTYATTPSGESTAREELEACRDAGLPVAWETDLELPYPTTGAVKLADQAQFNSMDAIAALAADLRKRGGRLFSGIRVRDVHVGRESTVESDSGNLDAGEVILATGTPILDRGLYFAKLMPKRSYCVAFRVPGAIPQGMYLSADSTTRSLRTAWHGGEQLLVVGGNGHTVGRASSTRACYDDLVAWTRQQWPGAEPTHFWSAQDYVSINSVPFVGKLPRGGGHVYMATGYAKWGMTNAPAAAIRLASSILGGQLQWAHTLGTRISFPHAGLTAAKANVEVGFELAKGWASVALHGVDSKERPAEGTGIVGRSGVEPVAVSTVDGTTCAVSAVCTHLKGIVAWNDAEKSWDCPLHGSRFGADGTVLEGPATTPLARRPTG